MVASVIFGFDLDAVDIERPWRICSLEALVDICEERLILTKGILQLPDPRAGSLEAVAARICLDTIEFINGSYGVWFAMLLYI